MNDTTISSAGAPNGRSADASRRLQLIEVTLASLAEVGAQGTTLAYIAGKAGVSAGLVAHYFTDKEGLLEAAFRALLAKHREQLRWRLTAASEASDRLKACVEACLSPEGLRASDSRAWLAFWSLVHQSAPLARIQRVYQRRMLSSLRAALRPLVPAQELAERAASIAALLEGTWLQAALAGAPASDSTRLSERVLRHVTAALGERLPSMPESPMRAGAKQAADHDDASRMASYNPATGEVLAWVPVAGPLQIDEAVARARAAQPAWAALTGTERARILR
ncbi:MAG: transcriptional regulator BetI, partial [Gammaproteobacteria bacterium]|nr:transcriptional regulator BetI [Gammaproteobacteria bacterium]